LFRHTGFLAAAIDVNRPVASHRFSGQYHHEPLTKDNCLKIILKTLFFWHSPIDFRVRWIDPAHLPFPGGLARGPENNVYQKSAD
jgi:hypothetical protein